MLLSCDGFFDCASALTKSVAQMTYNVVLVLSNLNIGHKFTLLSRLVSLSIGFIVDSVSLLTLI